MHLSSLIYIWEFFRFNVWNLYEILRHVDRNPKTFRTTYPNSYLKLPLLKFEMLEAFAVPPEVFEVDGKFYERICFSYT